MSVISDFVIAQPADAAFVLQEAAPTRRWPGVEAKGIGTIELATLKFILDGRPLDVDPVVDYSMAIKALAIEGEEGPWVFLVPEELIDQLGSLSQGALPRVAEQWHRTEELERSAWSESEVLDVLTKLRVLAARARVERKSVLLFLAL